MRYAVSEKRFRTYAMSDLQGCVTLIGYRSCRFPSVAHLTQPHDSSRARLSLHVRVISALPTAGVICIKYYH